MRRRDEARSIEKATCQPAESQLQPFQSPNLSGSSLLNFLARCPMDPRASAAANSEPAAASAGGSLQGAPRAHAAPGPAVWTPVFHGGGGGNISDVVLSMLPLHSLRCCLLQLSLFVLLSSSLLVDVNNVPASGDGRSRLRVRSSRLGRRPRV